MKYYIILLSLLLSSSSFAQSSMENLEKVFTNENLSPTALIAFEERAKQKLIDFGNYHEFITDQNLEIQFRANAEKMIYKLFHDTISCIQIVDSKTIVYDLRKYLDLLYKTKYEKIVVEIEDLEFINSLNKTEKSTYYGKIKYRQKTNYYSNEKDPDDYSYSDNVASIILVRKAKNFGNTEKLIWEMKIQQIEMVMN